MLENYLKKYAFREMLIEENPKEDLGLIVVIPAHDEESLLPTLKSLSDCEPLRQTVEVIVVFNASEMATAEVILKNQHAKAELEQWYSKQENLPFSLFCIEESQLPKKHAGVGLARKVGMDEAVRRFKEVNYPKGVIVCFDADSACQNNYLKAIQHHFQENEGACSIHFEHPLSGEAFSQEVYEGIYYYELHLRYYKNGLDYANLPYAYHTIGSSMAVQAIDYCKQGGMNRRKAGEDFYFLQKFIDVGKLTELNVTTVIPSPRASHRVPFGTGRAIQEMIDNEREIKKSYSFDCFILLKECFKNVGSWYKEVADFHPYLVNFYGEELLLEKMNSIRSQSTSKERFVKRFFQWFNAFQCLKFIHFLRDHYYPLMELETEVKRLLESKETLVDKEDLLEKLRKIDAA